jgi:hypothetical protein
MRLYARRIVFVVCLSALMMGRDGCGSCHAADGRGGMIRVMTGTAIKAPDVTYGALIRAGFTDRTIGTAIRDGRDDRLPQRAERAMRAG